MVLYFGDPSLRSRDDLSIQHYPAARGFLGVSGPGDIVCIRVANPGQANRKSALIPPLETLDEETYLACCDRSGFHRLFVLFKPSYGGV